jgi:hypothetical protein
MIKHELQNQHNALCHQYKNEKSLVEVDNLYATICCWWLSSGVVLEVGVHELANHLNFGIFVLAMERFHGPCEHFTHELHVTPFFF